jgi:hypothetical protein
MLSENVKKNHFFNSYQHTNTDQRAWIAGTAENYIASLSREQVVEV